MPAKRPYATGLVELLVRDVSGTACGDDFVQWAVQALVDGFDSPALRKLAGMDGASRCDARAAFDQAVSELALDVPRTKEVTLRTYLRLLARDLIAGHRQPADVLDLVHRDVLGPLNHPDDLMPWCYLSESLDPLTFDSLSDDARDAAARELARRTLDGRP